MLIIWEYQEDSLENLLYHNWFILFQTFLRNIHLHSLKTFDDLIKHIYPKLLEKLCLSPHDLKVPNFEDY